MRIKWILIGDPFAGEAQDWPIDSQSLHKRKRIPGDPTAQAQACHVASMDRFEDHVYRPVLRGDTVMFAVHHSIHLDINNASSKVLEWLAEAYVDGHNEEKLETGVTWCGQQLYLASTGNERMDKYHLDKLHKSVHKRFESIGFAEMLGE